MARVASSIPNLFNGISQQADALRLPTQGEAQFNMYPSLVQGLVKRPPLQVISKLEGHDSTASPYYLHGTFHVVDRGGDSGGRERVFLYITTENIRAIRPDGTIKNVVVEGNALEYLKSNRKGRFDVVTIADHTFISNPTMKTAMSGSSGAPENTSRAPALFQVKQAAYDTLYKVEVGVRQEGSSDAFQPLYGMYKTPSATGTTDNPPPSISTNEIARALAKTLYSAAESYAERNGTVVPINGDVINSVFSVVPEPGFYLTYAKVTDDKGNTLMTCVFKTVSRFSDLPASAIPGMVVKVTGSDTTAYNDYYVRFEAVDSVNGFSGISDGVWKEHHAPGVSSGLLASTMPHILVDNGGHFVFKACDKWAGRTVGDENTAPDPEFVGRPITGIFQYRNRLGLLSEDVVALSEASNFFNFFPTTVVTSVDSDPIFLSASTNGAPTLRHALAFNEEIIIFADRSQFKLASPEILSPATAAINTLTAYPMNTMIKPVANGKNIFFADSPSAFGEATRIYEYFIDADTGTKAAMDITAHVPHFVSETVTDMVCSPGLSLLCLYSQRTNKLWFYKYYWSGQEKLQSAWFECSAGADGVWVQGAAFIGDVLYFLLRNPGDGYYLCKMDFGTTLTADTDNGLPHLDMLVSDHVLSGNYYYNVDETEVVLPAAYKPDMLVIIDTDTRQELHVASISSHFYTKARIKGNVTGRRVFIGERYPSYYTFTRAFVRERKGEGTGQLSAHAGRLQLQKWRFVLGPTGHFEAHVIHRDGREFVYPWNSPPIGLSKRYLGSASLATFQTVDIPARGNAAEVIITVRNDSWLPSSIISAEWEGNYTTKGLQRI